MMIARYTFLTLKEQTDASLAGRYAGALERSRGGLTRFEYSESAGDERIFWGSSEAHVDRRARLHSRRRAALLRWRAKHG